MEEKKKKINIKNNDIYENYYEPQEDSYLLKKVVEEYSKEYEEKNNKIIKNAIDVCTGTGIVANSIIANQIIGIDINPKAIKEAKKRYGNEKIKWKIGDLFPDNDGKIKENNKFDLITCNPPYLPNELHDPDIALDGGKKGHEFICNFLKKAIEHLTYNGVILLLFSSRSNPDEIFKLMKKLNMKYEKISSENYFFERLEVYKIQKQQ